MRPSGLYAVHDNTIVFTDPSDGTTFEAALGGSGFTATYQGIVLVFARRSAAPRSPNDERPRARDAG